MACCRMGRWCDGLRFRESPNVKCSLAVVRCPLYLFRWPNSFSSTAPLLEQEGWPKAGVVDHEKPFGHRNKYSGQRTTANEHLTFGESSPPQSPYSSLGSVAWQVVHVTLAFNLPIAPNSGLFSFSTHFVIKSTMNALSACNFSIAGELSCAGRPDISAFV